MPKKDKFEKKIMQKKSSNFIVNHIESEKPVNQVISEAEEKIICGDISEVYKELEKTEKIISVNISRILVDIFNSIQVMNIKKEFVDYIKNIEVNNISQNDISFLENRLNEYRNIELPNKWDEMKYKIQFTNKISHYKAWYEGLQQGRYKMVVTNIKEFVVKEIIKKILKELALKYKDLNVAYSNLTTLLDSKTIDIDDIKNKFKEIIELPNINKIRNSELFIQFESYMVYYFYLNYDLTIEEEIVNKILQELKNIKSIKDKYKYLINEKENIINSIKNNELRNEIEGTFDKFIHLYNTLNEKDKGKEKFDFTKEKVIEREESTTKTIEFLDNIYKDSKKTNKAEKLLNKLNSLSDTESIDVICSIKFDPRFENHFSDVEDDLYDKDWGRIIGAITLKTKKIEKEFGMHASEQYLEDIAKRIAFKMGEDSFIVKKIRTMRENLIKIHQEGARKLKYLQKRLENSKNSAEKIVELQKLSKSSDYNGIFGSIRNMERILVRDKFHDIYKRVKNIPIDTQKILFEGVYNDIKVLFKYEPEIVEKVEKYIQEINSKINNSKEFLSKIDDSKFEVIKDFKDGNLPFVELSEILDIDYPDKEKYQHEKIEKELKDYNHKINSGEVLSDEIEITKNEINYDKSIFKIEQSEESKELVKGTEDFLKALEEGLEYAKKLEELKDKEQVKDFIAEVMKREKTDFLETINALDNGLRSKNLSYDDLAKNYLMAAKYTTNKEAKGKVNEIVEVIRRIQKEVDPLFTLESKIAKLLDWINNEYKDNEHIKEVINNQIKEYILIKGREGGLLRELLDGLDKAKNKIKYLKDMMKNIEYRHLIPTIKTLIENIEKELEIPESKIDEEWIKKQLDGKDDDEKLDWLKLRKYWQKYEKHIDFINDEIKKCEIKFKEKKKKELEIYPNIIELAEYVLTLEGAGARQKFIKEQQEMDPKLDESFKAQRKLLFYLMGIDNDEPRKKVIELASRVTLSIPEKQKYLKLLKESNVPEKGELKSILNISDEDIAFAAVYVLRSSDPLYRRIKYLENLKSATDEKYIKYKESFGIGDKIINEVINYLSKKKEVMPKGETILGKEQELEESKLSEVIEEQLIQEIEEEQVEEKIESLENYEDQDINLEIIKEEKTTRVDKKNKKEEFKEETSDFLKDFDLTKLAEEEKVKDFEEESIEASKEKEKSLEFEKEYSESFAEEDIKEWEQGEVSSIKSTDDLLKEQIIREEFKKTGKREEEIAKKLEEKAIKTRKEIMDKVREKAHEIHEDKDKKTEDKISELLSFLTTCFPEAISVIITDTILPIFKGKDFDSEVHSLIQSINDSIFKPALQGKDVENNINFFNKKLSSENMNNIKTIVEKIKSLREEILNSIETQKVKDDKETKKPPLPKGVTSILIYLSRISPEVILDEIDKNLLNAIRDENVKNSLNLIYKNLKNIYEDIEFNSDEIKFMYIKLKFNDKDKEVFEEILHKIGKYKDKLKKTEGIKKLVKLSSPEKISIKEEGKEISQPTKELDQFFENEEGQEITGNRDVYKEIEDVLSGLTNFIKPHAVILDIVRKNKNLNEEDFNVDTRREIIDKLYNKGKIFTYDGTSYIGKGQINNIVKNNIIPTPEKAIFLHKLNEFLGTLRSKEEIYDFLGVKDDMEFKKLNFNLDKYGVGREPLTHIVDKVGISREEKRAPIIKRSPKRIAKIKTKPIMVGDQEKSIIEPGKKEKEQKELKPFHDLYKERLKEAKKKDEEHKLTFSEMIEQQKSFISKTQRDILNEAEKVINKNLERLIKSAKTKNDLESIQRNYIGDSEFNKKNQLNLCYEIKKIANIIDKDRFLFSKLSFNQEKIKKIYDNRMKRYNK